MSEILSSKIVKTRTAHNCFGCAREFPIGTKMLKEGVLDSNKVFSCYLCETCQTIVGNMRYNDEFGYGDLKEEALETEGHFSPEEQKSYKEMLERDSIDPGINIKDFYK